MTNSLEKLRRAAKALKRAHGAGDEAALKRVQAVIAGIADLSHANALHVVARESGHESWPRLKFAFEAAAADRAEQAEMLKMALFFGQHWRVAQLLEETPDLGRDNFGLMCSLYDAKGVQAVLSRDPDAAKRKVGIRTPMTHLAFSQHIKGAGDADQMLMVAAALLADGADVNDAYPYNGDETMPLSALYGAIGHGDNMVLAEWLLDNGANPDDGESLYHSTELGHHKGLELLIKHGVNPAGTNALPHALDFNDHVAVSLLLQAGADPNEGIAQHVSGEPPFVIPGLHQAARRMCDAKMIALLLDAGADPSARYEGMTPFAIARAYGNADAARLIADAGGDQTLSREEELLAAAADGTQVGGSYIDVGKLSEEYRNMIRAILHLPGKLDHIKRLVAIGMEYDHVDPMGLTPVQIAGWEGLTEVMAYFLRLKPDLGHINNYGGTLLSTIIHGSENCPKRSERDHIGCARLALAEGVALPRRAPKLAGEPAMAAFLADWAERYPGQVVEEGPA